MIFLRAVGSESAVIDFNSFKKHNQMSIVKLVLCIVKAEMVNYGLIYVL